MNNPQFQSQFDSQEPKTPWFSAHMLLGVVFLLASGAAIVTGMYYWQTVKSLPQTVDFPVHREWKTYTNSEYGFEFKYPEEFATEPYNEVVDQKQSERGVIIEKGDLAVILSINNSIYMGSAPTVAVSDEAKTFGNLAVRKNIYYAYQILPERTWILEYRFENKNNKYTLLTAENDETGSGKISESTEKVMEQILSTFKFTEPEVCIQVITPARNKTTGEEKVFPTPCDVPEGWEKIDADM